MTSKAFFLDALPPLRTSPFSFSVHDPGLLRAVFRQAAVVVLGNSCRVRRDLQTLLRFAELQARSVRVSPLPDDREELTRLLRGLGRSDRPLIILAEDRYGPAYASLGRSVPGEGPILPVLFPSGYLLPLVPQARLLPTHPEAASLSPLGRTLEALTGKSVAVWNAGTRYRYLLNPLIKTFGTGLRVAAIIDEDRETWGSTLDGIPVRAPDDLGVLAYDAVVGSVDGSGRVYPLLHRLVSGLTPVLFFGENDLLSHAAYVHPLAADLPGRFERLYYEPFLTREKYAVLYADHPRRSEAHFRSVSQTRIPLTLRRDTFEHADVDLDGLTIRDGQRVTANVPGNSKRFVHLFGPSYTLCSLSADEDTIASHLQNLCNTAFGSRFTVVNHGVAGNTMQNITRQITGTPLQPGDLVLIMPPYQQYGTSLDLLRHAVTLCHNRAVPAAVFFQPSLLRVRHPSAFEKALLSEYGLLHGILSPEGRDDHDPAPLLAALNSLGIPAFDLQPFFQRPHEAGECFVDSIHLAGTGNEHAARQMFAAFVAACKTRPLPVVPPLPDDELTRLRARLDRDFMDHVRSRFLTSAAFVDWLETVPRFAGDGRTGAIVMNCNPFTLGYAHVIEKALDQIDRLYIFAVEEDASAFSFADRLEMIRQGAARWGRRVLVVPSGRFILSSFTFPEYFCKDQVAYTPDTSVEAALFGTLVAPELGIDTRFFGEEPTCAVTRAYHARLKDWLPLCGVAWVEIPRLTDSHAAISASRVREALAAGRFEALPGLVPLSTLRRLKKLLREKA